jgi:hypothetical protein
VVVVDEKTLDSAGVHPKAQAAAKPAGQDAATAAKQPVRAQDPATDGAKAKAGQEGTQAAAAKHPAAHDADAAKAAAAKRPVRPREPGQDAEPRAKEPAKQGALQNQLF